MRSSWCCSSTRGTHILVQICIYVCLLYIWVRQNQWSVLGSRLTSLHFVVGVLFSRPEKTPWQIRIWFNFMQFQMLLCYLCIYFVFSFYCCYFLEIVWASRRFGLFTADSLMNRELSKFISLLDTINFYLCLSLSLTLLLWRGVRAPHCCINLNAMGQRWKPYVEQLFKYFCLENGAKHLRWHDVIYCALNIGENLLI